MPQGGHVDRQHRLAGFAETAQRRTQLTGAADADILQFVQIQRQGRISFYMEAKGEEAVSIGAAMALRAGDMCFPSYRNQGLFMYRGVKLVDMMCQCLSNTKDMCKGRQLPIMYHSGKGNVFSISGNLATQYPHAVGWAMASAIKGEDHIAATWLESAGHCANLMDAKYSETGIAYALNPGDGRDIYWVQVYAE